MKPIDFDARYADFAEKWIRSNRGRYKNAEEMEARLPEIYLRFINSPADDLNGATPAQYFQRFERPEPLVELLRDYVKEDVDVPDLLLDRLTAMDRAAVEPLLTLAAEENAAEPLRAIALNLLIELGASEPMPLCLALIDARAKRDDLADVAAELLEALGSVAVQPMLERLSAASDAALSTYLDLLCNFPDDPRVYEYTLRQFHRMADERALFASYLGKLGDERAIEPLTRALRLSDLNYLDYLEIRNAIERLGGTMREPERRFDGDPYYESMRRL